mgnify:CR=1 FL=1
MSISFPVISKLNFFNKDTTGLDCRLFNCPFNCFIFLSFSSNILNASFISVVLNNCYDQSAISGLIICPVIISTPSPCGSKGYLFKSFSYSDKASNKYFLVIGFTQPLLICSYTKEFNFLSTKLYCNYSNCYCIGSSLLFSAIFLSSSVLIFSSSLISLAIVLY